MEECPQGECGAQSLVSGAEGSRRKPQTNLIPAPHTIGGWREPQKQLEVLVPWACQHCPPLLRPVLPSLSCIGLDALLFSRSAPDLPAAEATEQRAGVRPITQYIKQNKPRKKQLSVTEARNEETGHFTEIPPRGTRAHWKGKVPRVIRAPLGRLQAARSRV
ncbi:hypothetical protein NDU88_009819 [Pleurodeles waltl]|uniref:Uncharacterized protein n=1 Tax=Pleurodeles waltl TaxID=8319 RepID=A0AAV7PTA3_PLEWA|nr:hypothetical protein NDU88_009819 [Pleurodeles waltl]